MSFSFSFAKVSLAKKPKVNFTQRINEAAQSRQSFDDVISWIDTGEVSDASNLESYLRFYNERMQNLSAPIFCFGSNLAGIHGKGAALFAIQERGAVRGQGFGFQGNSFAIPTKDTRILTLPISDIAEHVREFLVFALDNPDKLFEITPIGCGLAGYKPMDIAPLFLDAPINCMLPKEFGDAAQEIMSESYEPPQIHLSPRYK